MTIPAPPQSAARAERVNLARGRAFDRYLSLLLAPRALREDLLALAAFASELDLIPERVSEPMLGEIRYQWWRDELQRLRDGGAGQGHPVADAMVEMVRRPNFPVAYLNGMIDARAFDLGGVPIPDLGALEAYARKTEGAHGRLVAHLAAGPSQACDIAERAGTAYGLATVSSRAGRYAALTAPILRTNSDAAPQTSAGPHGCSHTRGVLSIDEVRQRTQQLILEVRTALKDAPPGPWRCALFPAALTGLYMTEAERLGADGLQQQPAQIGPFARVVRLTRARLTGHV